MLETRVQSLAWEDPLEKEMATPSSVLAWRIPWAEEPGGYSPWGLKSRSQLSGRTAVALLYDSLIISSDGLPRLSLTPGGEQADLSSTHPAGNIVKAIFSGVNS